MGLLERIKEVEDEMARTQKNKATNGHMGRLKAKAAKLRSELVEGEKTSKGTGPAEGFDVRAAGDARVALIGFPSVGKSSMLSKLTTTASEAAAYEFTTLTCIPGKVHYRGSTIQLLDLPGIIEGAAQGKGRGRPVIAVARNADCIMMVLDASKGDEQRHLLEKELEACGIRLNKRKPNIYFKIKPTGGIKWTTTVTLTKGLSEDMCKGILQEYKLHCCECLIREDCTVDDFIDVLEGNRRYIPCLYVYNKIDCLCLEELHAFASRDHSLVCSVHWGLNLDYLLEKTWDYLRLVRVFTKKRGCKPDLEEPVCNKYPVTVETICKGVHKDFVDQFKYALVWGTSTKHTPQRCGLKHQLDDEDVIQIMTK